MSTRSSVLAVSASAVVLAVAMLAAGPSLAWARPAHTPRRVFCFSNLAVRSEVGIVSEDVDEGENAFDSRGADDFRLSTRCRVSAVGFDGLVYNGVADSFTVTFYKDKGGLPGRVVSTATSSEFGPCPPHVVCDTSVTLPTPVTLRRGAGWVSVQANVGLAEEFVWMTAVTQNGKPAVWENPDNGFGTGCTTWATLQTCWGSLNPGPDFEFVLLK
jgi:hypothetical protein